MNDYVVEKTLGSGSFGRVKLAKCISTGKYVAIKVISLQNISDQPHLLHQIHTEIALMKLLDHPNILCLYSVLESPKAIYLIEQYAQNGSLYDRIMSIDFATAISYFRQIIYGLEYLHLHGVSHRDIKAENILLDSSNQILIADFGFACWMPQNIAYTTCGSIHYTSPETMSGKPYDGRAADIWSAGVLLYAMINHRLPFDEESIQLTIHHIKVGNFQRIADPTVNDLISRILTVDPEKRISIEQIKQHPVFRFNLPESYAVPSPLPLPCLSRPIDSPDKSTLETLRQIGFDDSSQLESLLSSSSPNMAKTFYLMLKESLELDDIPWGSPPSFSVPLIQEHPFVFPVDPESPPDPESPHSKAYQSLWLPSLNQQLIYEQERQVRRIQMAMPRAMASLQLLLSEGNYDWFHPNDREIIAKYPNLRIFVIFFGEFEESGTISIAVKMKSGSQKDFDELFDSVVSLFKGHFLVCPDAQLSDLNSIQELNDSNW